MNEIKYYSLDLKMKMVFFPLDTTPLILPIICFFHSCVIMVVQPVHSSGPSLLPVNLDNPISFCPESSCICILHCAVPPSSALTGVLNCWGVLLATNDLGARSECENITKNLF